MYVQFMVPMVSKSWPLIMVHGSGYTGSCVEGTAGLGAPRVSNDRSADPKMRPFRNADSSVNATVADVRLQ
jgi:hypothetical protein